MWQVRRECGASSWLWQVKIKSERKTESTEFKLVSLMDLQLPCGTYCPDAFTFLLAFYTMGSSGLDDVM